MKIEDREASARHRGRFEALWPQCPLAVVIALVGFLNIAQGSGLRLAWLPHIGMFDELADTLAVLGGTAQGILGLMLVLVGTGLLWRLVSAWMLSVLLLVIAVGATLLAGDWGAGSMLQACLLLGLLLAKSHFTRRTALANIVFSLSGVLAILAYGVFGSYLLGKGFRPEIHDMGTAVYYTVVTLSTVGYGDIVPVTPEARWFAVSLLVVGLGVFASAVASALGPKISGELSRLLKPKEKPMQPKDHVILVGEGPVALNTLAELRRRGVDLVQIVASAQAGVGDAEDRVVAGDASDDTVLRRAGIDRARMVIAAREDDGENAFISLVAKDLKPDVRVLAVASSAAAVHRLKLAKADFVFSPAAVGSRLMADWVEGAPMEPAFRDLLEGNPRKKEA